MICYSRANYLRRALQSVLRYHPGGDALPIFVSQDAAIPAVSQVISEFQTEAKVSKGVKVLHLKHSQKPGAFGEDGYHKLAQHYGWALAQVFDDRLGAFRRVIILEEDLEIAPDFFDYFAATAPLLDDPNENLLAVSAWNDNGQTGHVSDAQALYRSDFFSGLGWMMTRTIWQELAPRWPGAYWDDWLREPAQRRERQFLRPEVCRTYHFATQGVSNNQYSDFLTTIELNKTPVPFRSMSLDYLRRDRYDRQLRQELQDAPLLTARDIMSGIFPPGDAPVRVEYPSTEPEDFEPVAHKLRIMENIKAGVPRTAYAGVITVRLGQDKRKVHVTPPLDTIRLFSP